MRLLRVELRRLFSRRVVLLLIAAAFVVPLLMLIAVAQTAEPISAEELAQAEAVYAEQLAVWEETGEEQIAQCEADEEREREATGQDVDWGCEGITAPELEWFLRPVPTFAENVTAMLDPLSALLLAIGLVVGATFTAAEFATGSVGMWLTFEPRRVRVYATKLLAPALVVAAVAAVSAAMFVAGDWTLFNRAGLAAGTTTATWTAVGWMVLRIGGLGLLAALGGAALGFLVRHTAGVLGIAVGYAVVELVVRGLVTASPPWLISTNVAGWVRHGTTYYLETCAPDGAGGVLCEVADRAVSFGHSALYLLALTAVVVAVGTLAFSRRDVR
ncbi:ABC transporter permease subunit [Georgenia faecalis]|uniref:ABC transporter permease subunit n=1 Tax=Georgenia faecalis TaxID=2483799 RepID=A0ABV9D617_9MICO